MTAIVCGGRDVTDQALVFGVLSRLHGELPFDLIVEGGQRTRDDRGWTVGGADYWAMRWARAHEVPVVTMAADWRRYGPAAGPIRNQAMLDLHRPSRVVAFAGGPGTNDMIARARREGVGVIHVGKSGWAIAYPANGEQAP